MRSDLPYKTRSAEKSTSVFVRLKILTLTLAGCALVLSPGAWSAESESKAHDFAKWEPEIKAFEEMDKTNRTPRNAVLFIGSSTIRLWKTLSEDFPAQTIINRGFGGSEIEDSTHFADRIVFPYRPRMIFIRAGGNDIHAGKSPERVLADFQEFVSTVQSKLPRTKIFYISGFPSIARWDQADKERELNRLISDYAGKTQNLRFVDVWAITLGPGGKPREDVFAEDKLHLNEKGYDLLAERVRQFMPD